MLNGYWGSSGKCQAKGQASKGGVRGVDSVMGTMEKRLAMVVGEAGERGRLGEREVVELSSN